MKYRKEYKKVILDVDDQIARLTLNYPEKRNAMDFVGDGGIVDDYYAALGVASNDDEVKVIIIKAAGPHFCGGHDISRVGRVYGMGEGKPGDVRIGQQPRLKVDRETFSEGMKKLFLCPKITIAQVQGYCVGEGIIMVELCDLAVAAEDTILAHYDMRLGFGGSAASSFMITAMQVGLKRALELFLLVKEIDGKEAERIGLVNKAVPLDKLEEATEEMARKICLIPRDGIALGKAQRELYYDRVGFVDNFTSSYILHTLFTQLKWQPGEYNFFKYRREKGMKEAIAGMTKHWGSLPQR